LLSARADRSIAAARRVTTGGRRGCLAILIVRGVSREFPHVTRVRICGGCWRKQIAQCQDCCPYNVFHFFYLSSSYRLACKRRSLAAARPNKRPQYRSATARGLGLSPKGVCRPCKRAGYLGRTEPHQRPVPTASGIPVPVPRRMLLRSVSCSWLTSPSWPFAPAICRVDLHPAQMVTPCLVASWRFAGIHSAKTGPFPTAARGFAELRQPYKFLGIAVPFAQSVVNDCMRT
jgi:hypothetical protein